MLVLTSLFMSVWCVAIYELQDTGQILHFIRKFFEKWQFVIDRGNSKIHRFVFQVISKPMSTCVICFASIWGSAAYFFLLGTVSLDWLFCTVICSLFNYIIYRIVRILEKI